jgi:hypothetical protein
MTRRSRAATRRHSSNGSWTIDDATPGALTMRLRRSLVDTQHGAARIRIAAPTIITALDSIVPS